MIFFSILLHHKRTVVLTEYIKKISYSRVWSEEIRCSPCQRQIILPYICYKNV